MSPFRLGNLTLRNRIVQPPHQIQMEEAGLPSDRSLAYYLERARGGASMLVAGGFTIDPRRIHSDPVMRLLTDPRVSDGLGRIADAVHQEGAAFAVQLHWNGRHAPVDHVRLPALAPSALPEYLLREIPKELEADEIERLVELYGVATANVRAAGLDGVEILAGQSYGINQFLSPLSNHRSDRYGGSLGNRMRLLLEVVDRVRDSAGPTLLVGVRLSGDDFQEGGHGLSEAVKVAGTLEATGKVDYLSITGGSSENRLYIADMGYPQGVLVPLAAELRSATRLPLIAVVRIKQPSQAEAILARGDADLIGMNRALLADPQLPNKVRSGRLDEIRPCIGCNQGCLQRTSEGFDLSCTVNPTVGGELTLGPLVPAALQRRLVVVGGGPAGLEAARIAAERGHRVTLHERRPEIGGQLAVAARARTREELQEIIGWLGRELNRLGVEVRLRSNATAETVLASQPDAVVVATGSKPLRTGYSSVRPQADSIPGHELAHVATAWEVLEGAHLSGQQVLILEDDPHLQAVTVAIHLASGGNRVTIMTRNPQVGMAVGWANLAFWYRRLFAAGVAMVANTWVTAIHGDGVDAYNVYSGEPVTLGGFDRVVLTTGNEVEDTLYRELHQQAPDLELHRVGDCLAPRRLDAAMWEAGLAGRSI